MLNKKYLFFVMVTLLSLSLEVKEIFGANDGIVAIVNEEVITESDLNSSRIFPNKSVSFLIEKKIELQTANKLGIGVTPSEISSAMEDIMRENSFFSEADFETALLKQGISMEDYKRDLKEQLILLKLINREIKSRISVTDSESEEYYSSNKDLFSMPEEIRIGYIHIPVKTNGSSEVFNQAKEKIFNILTSFKREASFSEIRRVYSEQPDVLISEDLGFIKRGELLQELDKVAFTLKKGEISDVISTTTGFYILKMLEKKEVEYIPFIEVKDKIKEILFQEKSEKRIKEWLYELKTVSYIDVKM